MRTSARIDLGHPLTTRVATWREVDEHETPWTAGQAGFEDEEIFLFASFALHAMNALDPGLGPGASYAELLAERLAEDARRIGVGAIDVSSTELVAVEAPGSRWEVLVTAVENERGYTFAFCPKGIAADDYHLHLPRAVLGLLHALARRHAGDAATLRRLAAAAERCARARIDGALDRDAERALAGEILSRTRPAGAASTS